MIKVGNTSFREEVIRKLSLKQFKDAYKDILKGQDLDRVYKEVTGFSSSDIKHQKGTTEVGTKTDKGGPGAEFKNADLG